MSVRDGQRWGDWEYDKSRLVLEFDRLRSSDGRDWYEVDLEECTTGLDVLDWILQVAGKRWATPADIGALVLALESLLGPLQNKILNDDLDFCSHLRKYISPQRYTGG